MCLNRFEGTDLLMQQPALLYNRLYHLLLSINKIKQQPCFKTRSFCFVMVLIDLSAVMGFYLCVQRSNSSRENLFVVYVANGMYCIFYLSPQVTPCGYWMKYNFCNHDCATTF